MSTQRPTTPTQPLTPDAAFFFEWAGYSYKPPEETPAQGATRGAIALAVAEARARAGLFAYQWKVDEYCDSREFSSERPYWSLWVCTMIDPEGKPCQSLHGIDFGRDGEPWGDPYKRVCEAELALEQFA